MKTDVDTAKFHQAIEETRKKGLACEAVVSAALALHPCELELMFEDDDLLNDDEPWVPIPH